MRQPQIIKTFQMERQFLFVLITVLYPIFLITDHYRRERQKKSDCSHNKIKEYFGRFE